AANVDLEVKSFDEALQSINTLASEGRGYVATTSSQKQENGKLRGQVIIKILPENLDGFLLKLRKLGDLKNQTLATEDVTKAHAQLSLFAADVEKTYSEIKTLASPTVQIAKARLDRDGSGRISARISMLIAPANADGLIAKVKSLGRVENYQLQSERVSRAGEGMSQEAKTERDKVHLEIAISQQNQEAARQQTSLSIRGSDVT